MFERPSDPRSKSYEKRTQVWTVVMGVSQLRQNHVQNMTSKELREMAYELEKVLALVNRQQWLCSIRMR